MEKSNQPSQQTIQLTQSSFNKAQPIDNRNIKPVYSHVLADYS